jgi:hypothetical protein
LIWFAVGAACTALVALLTRLLTPSTDEQHFYLAVYDRPYSEEEIEKFEEIASSSAQLLHQCDAKGFLIKRQVGTDSVPFSLVQASADNRNAIQCIFMRGALEGHSVDVLMITEKEARSL